MNKVYIISYEIWHSEERSILHISIIPVKVLCQGTTISHPIARFILSRITSTRLTREALRVNYLLLHIVCGFLRVVYGLIRVLYGLFVRGRTRKCIEHIQNVSTDKNAMDRVATNCHGTSRIMPDRTTNHAIREWAF